MLLKFDFAFKLSNIIPVILSMVLFEERFLKVLNKKSYSTIKQWFPSVCDSALVSVYSSRVGLEGLAFLVSQLIPYSITAPSVRMFM